MGSSSIFAWFVVGFWVIVCIIFEGCYGGKAIIQSGNNMEIFLDFISFGGFLLISSFLMRWKVSIRLMQCDDYLLQLADLVKI